LLIDKEHIGGEELSNDMKKNKAVRTHRLCCYEIEAV
jgi:hypothetical protein